MSRHGSCCESRSRESFDAGGRVWGGCFGRSVFSRGGLGRCVAVGWARGTPRNAVVMNPRVYVRTRVRTAAAYWVRLAICYLLAPGRNPHQREGRVRLSPGGRPGRAGPKVRTIARRGPFDFRRTGQSPKAGLIDKRFEEIFSARCS